MAPLIDILPDIGRLTQDFAQATAPTFFLGATAAFVSLMSSRLSDVLARLRALDLSCADDHVKGERLKLDARFLRRRARLLSRGIYASILAAVCATILLAVLFTSSLFGLQHAFFAPSLFILATIALGFGLVRFIQEARLGIIEADQTIDLGDKAR
ncbi:MAG: hypothetical protein JWO64_2120 [Hyphomicrobiales bacterium]|nr:hypothetical protein [Hyphomicrobiales bacterium]